MNRDVMLKISEVKKRACDAMESCMANITVGDAKNAIHSRGQASVWEEILCGAYGEDLLDNEHYETMCNIYRDWLNKITISGT